MIGISTLPVVHVLVCFVIIPVSSDIQIMFLFTISGHGIFHVPVMTSPAVFLFESIPFVAINDGYAFFVFRDLKP